MDKAPAPQPAPALAGGKTPSDVQILRIVAESIADAHRSGDNWADTLDDSLREAGFALADAQPDGSDPWEIVTLADGRTVYLSDESATGAARYRIA